MDNYDGYVKIGTKIDDKDLKPQLQKTKTNILSTMKTIGIGTAAAAAAVAGFVKIAGELNKAYMVQASAERALATAAKNNPYLNDRSIQNLKAYASELQKVSNYGDEVTIGLMAQLAAAGRTEAEIQKIIKASADLAASGTTTFDGAVRNLNKTFSGLSGELGEVIPELKNLTAEQMKNGDAVDLIAKKYEGMALSVVDKSVQAKNALGDLSEQMGRWLSPVVDWLSSSFGTLAAKMAEVLSAANDLRDAQKAVDEGTGTAKDKIIIYQNQIEAIKNEMSTLIAYDELGQKIYTQAYKDKEEEIKQIEEAIKKEEKRLEIEARLAHAKSIGAKDAAAQAEKELAIQKEADEKEKKQIAGRIAAQQRYEAAVNLATEKQKGGLITLEEKWDDIKSAAEAYTDALINLGYTYEETATIGGKALDDMRRKLTGNDLSKGLGFTGVIGGEGFLNPLTKIAEQWKITIPEITGLMEDGAQEAVQGFNKALGDNENSSLLAIKDFTKNVASSFAMGLSIAKNIVSSVFTAIKALATFSPAEIIDDIKKTIEGLTEFFTVELPLLPVYFASGATIIREFLRGMTEGLPNTVEIIKNVLSEIFENIKDNIEKDATSALTVASSLLLAIVSALPDAVIAVGQVATGLVNAITKIAPELIKGLVSGIIALLPVALDMIIDFLDSWYDTLPDLVSGLIDAIVDLIPDLVSGLISILPKLLMMMNPFNLEIIALWFEILLKILPSLFLLPINVWAGILEGIANIVIDIIDGIVLFLTDPKEWLRVQFSFIDGLVSALLAVPAKVIERVASVFTSLGGKISELISSALKIEPVITTPKNPLEGIKTVVNNVGGAISGAVSSIGGFISGLFKAEGTDYYRGGSAIINEVGAELVTLPTGAKVTTANATAGLVEQAVQSVMRGLGGFEGQQNQRPIILHNYMESVMNVNGKVLGKIAFENIDRNVRMQYGS